MYAVVTQTIYDQHVFAYGQDFINMPMYAIIICTKVSIFQKSSLTSLSYASIILAQFFTYKTVYFEVLQAT